MLVLTRKQDQEIYLTVGAERVVVKVVRIDGGQIRLGFTASRLVVVNRGENAPEAPAVETALCLTE